MVDPAFKHDCKECLFCGQIGFMGLNRADVYACGKITKLSVIVRYGDSGREFYSLPLWAASSIPAYQDAISAIKDTVFKKPDNQ